MERKKVGHSGGFSVRAFSFFAVVFLGSFLLFLIEPLYAKLILPRFGGSASVWALCLVFYQTALLLGYFYADFSARKLGAGNQALIYIALLCASFFLFPITLGDQWRLSPGSNPAWMILGLLAVKIGLPFLLLSAASPLLQALYARQFPERKPFLLFAVSNTASLSALLIFPFFVEPYVPSSRQVSIWSMLYVLFALAAGFLIWRGRRFPATAPREDVGASHWKDRLIWIGLSACSSMLLLSVTNHFTQDIAPIPLFWVLPLALYLLSFILVFGFKNFYSRKWMGIFLPAVFFLLSWFFFTPGVIGPLWANVLFFCGGFFLGCLFCNGELAARKPTAKLLTHFYLMISLGGALGAVWVGIGAPLVFSDFYEFHLALFLTLAMAAFIFWNQARVQRIYLPLILFMMVCNFINQIEQADKSTVLRERNFYAASKVVSLERPGESPCLTLFNGATSHGTQFTDPGISMEPATYYSPRSGVGLALDWKGWGVKKVGVIGLGVGTLAAYGKAGDDFRFYEINPQVIQIAQSFFSFLKNTKAAAAVVEGDGRLSLEAEPSRRFDVLVLDAFSGDSIPFHLLTKEAFALYFSRLNPDGILAVHVSNIYLNLAPVAELAADDAGYPSVLVQNESDPGHLVFTADWVLITKNQKFLADPFVKAVEQDWPVPPGLRLWTDDDNSLFPLFKTNKG